ncbi:MAG: putative glycoside hydrolase [Eubacteriales bacterium]|nr:putative glycoside hydrolase [Eubacteriales bacterium]
MSKAIWPSPRRKYQQLAVSIALVTSLFLQGCTINLLAPAQSEPSPFAQATKDVVIPTTQASESTISEATTAETPPVATEMDADLIIGQSTLPIDPLVENFFGPLPVADQTIGYRHNELRALYLGAAANIDKTIELASQTNVNAVVIDLKESDGIKYASHVPLALESDSVRPAFNLPLVVEKFHAANIKVIGRIVCFKDPILAEVRPDLAIQDASGTPLLYKLEGKKPFVSPYNQTVWQYNVDIAKEAISLGVDEIQFDYVRFPTGGTTTGATPYYGPDGAVPSKSQAINRFILFSRIQIQDALAVPLGVDVFATIIISRSDGQRIGQDWATLGLLGIDRVSPMIYPSHYANNSATHYTGNGQGQLINGHLYEKPDFFPYDVMYGTLVTGQKAFEQPGYQITVMPYLQAFTATYLPDGYYMRYDAAAIREQIRAIEDAGYSEWVCWNSRAVYPTEAFLEAESHATEQ